MEVVGSVGWAPGPMEGGMRFGEVGSYAEDSLRGIMTYMVHGVELNGVEACRSRELG